MMSARSQANDQFCTGGSSRKADGSAGPGEICGWTVDTVGSTYEYASGHWYRNVVRSKSKTGWCNRPGDSGGPVYIVSGSNVYAKGILDAAGGGGSDYYGGALDRCSVAFTDIYEAYYGFPGVIRVG